MIVGKIKQNFNYQIKADGNCIYMLLPKFDYLQI